MKRKLFAILLALCLSLLLVACKSVDNTESASSSQSQQITGQTSDNVSQGTELEEDVFDNSDIQSGTASKEDLNVVTSSNEESSSNDKTESMPSTGDTSSSESSDNTSSEVTSSEDDGTVSLPIDWFD